MKNRGLSATVLNTIVAILVAFATFFSGLVRGLSIAILALILVHFIYRHASRFIFLVSLLIMVGVLGLVALQKIKNEPEGTRESESINKLEIAYRDAREKYNLGEFEKAVEILEPFVGAEGFEVQLTERAYHLLGLAYLSMPQPQCADAFRLLPNIGQRNLETSLAEKCRAVSCRQCTGGGLL